MKIKRCGTRNKLEKKEGGSFPLARTTHASRSLPLRLGLRPKTRIVYRGIRLLCEQQSPQVLTGGGCESERSGHVLSTIGRERSLIVALDFSNQGRDSSAHQYESASTFVLDSPPSRSSYDYRTCGSCRGLRFCGRR